MKVDGEKIRQMREERSWTLSELAEKAGLSASYLSELERGETNPSLKTIQKIASALNVDNMRLLHETERVVGTKLRLIRHAKGQTLAHAAKAAGISLSYLSEIERGNIAPSVKVIRGLAQVYGVPVSGIVGEACGMGPKLRDMRKAQGMTQSELAERAGVSAGLVGQIEKGKVQPSLQTVEKIASVLGVSPCYFILNETEEEGMRQIMGPALKELICQEKVQSVLRLLCDCSEKEIQFILNFIKLYKSQGSEAD